LVTWTEEIRTKGWEFAVDAILNSPEYLQANGDTGLPGDGRKGCGILMPLEASKTLVEQFYCRVLSRPVESDASILGWIEYLESNTVKDLVRVGLQVVNSLPDKTQISQLRLKQVHFMMFC
jgi:hypothetical protein